MCIILYKPAGIAMPDEDTLRTCWNGNPDGAGFMFPKNGAVQISKGFMHYEELANALRKLGNVTNLPLVVHWRIATHGKVAPSTCHPFPVCGKMRKMRKTELRTACAIAHNGIIHGLQTSNTVSDTMAYIASYAHPLMQSGELFEPWALELLERAADASRLAIMDAQGNVELLGTWHEHEGCYFSNENYKPYHALVGRGWSYNWETFDASKLPRYADPAPLYDGCEECSMYYYCSDFAAECTCQMEATETVRYEKALDKLNTCDQPELELA